MSRASELTERMQATSRGERCESCLFEGKVETANADGSALERCAGCGRMVCDRHTMREGHFRDRRHLLQNHATTQDRRRVVITEVKPD